MPIHQEWSDRCGRRGRLAHFLLLIIASCAVLPIEHVGAKDAIDATRRMVMSEGYLKAISETDAFVPVRFDAIAESAAIIRQRLADDLKAAGEKRAVAIPSPERVLEAIESLGEASVRVDQALAWMNFMIAGDRKSVGNARIQARLANIAEVRRVYQETQEAFAARRRATRELQTLFSGRGVVVKKDAYTGIVSEANAYETAQFVQKRRAAQNTPIRVRSARTYKPTNFFDPSQYREMAGQRDVVRQLSGSLKRELNAMRHHHRAALNSAIKSGSQERQARAVRSLGWWNGPEGIVLLHKALACDKNSIRVSGLGAMRRMDLSIEALDRLSRHRDKGVQAASIEILTQRVCIDHGAGPVFVKILRHTDPNDRIHQAAARALERWQEINRISIAAR